MTPIAGIDVFCGVGGLTYGLRQAGIEIVAGIDVDPACAYPFTKNNGAKFVAADVRTLTGGDLAMLYPKGAIRLLAGCAPCRPFSPSGNGAGTTNRRHEDWGLLDEFSRLVIELMPDLVTMENVPALRSKAMFRRFVKTLKDLDYEVDFRSVYCPRFGIPQRRRRLVLVASRLGEVAVPDGTWPEDEFRTVRDAIASLPRVRAGHVARGDVVHKAASLSPVNRARLLASKPGGSWRDWPKELRAKCHRKRRAENYRNVYGRMSWDEPAPVITTQAFKFGTGRFGHPTQNRALTLREAAVLQTFPRRYRFVQPRSEAHFHNVGRLIGNAVPPRLGRAIGHALVKSVRAE